jgi:hypothetical protein
VEAERTAGGGRATGNGLIGPLLLVGDVDVENVNLVSALRAEAWSAKNLPSTKSEWDVQCLSFVLMSAGGIT